MPALRVLIVSEHTSAAFGGEAALPLHYFRVLRQYGHHVWLVVHARTRPELTRLFGDDPRIVFVEDTGFHRAMWWCAQKLPARLGAASFGYAMRIATQLAQRPIVKRLVRYQQIEVVHQPMPVSPREPSLMFGLGAPVVMGPMNGSIDFPPAFAKFQSPVVTAFIGCGRAVSGLLNRLMPGKRRCAILAVANQRTQRALPSGIRGKVVELVENGVDLQLWAGRDITDEAASTLPPRFVFMGRLVDWKAVDLLLLAFRSASRGTAMSLTIVGDGDERSKLQTMCREWGILAHEEGQAGRVYFAGWRAQPECAVILGRSSALVLPSLRECGGAVVLEAMAASRPVIATDWGGPADYLDFSCGILVKPTSREAFVAGLTAAMVRLAQSHAERTLMGRAGRRKVTQLFDWDDKVHRMVEIYQEAMRQSGS